MEEIKVMEFERSDALRQRRLKKQLLKKELYEELMFRRVMIGGVMVVLTLLGVVAGELIAASILL